MWTRILLLCLASLNIPEMRCSYQKFLAALRNSFTDLYAHRQVLFLLWFHLYIITAHVHISQVREMPNFCPETDSLLWAFLCIIFESDPDFSSLSASFAAVYFMRESEFLRKQWTEISALFSCCEHTLEMLLCFRRMCSTVIPVDVARNPFALVLIASATVAHRFRREIAIVLLLFQILSGANMAFSCNPSQKLSRQFFFTNEFLWNPYHFPYHFITFMTTHEVFMNVIYCNYWCLDVV